VLSVVSATVSGAAANTIDAALVTFNQPVDTASAVPVHVTLVLPNGAQIHPTSVQAVAGANSTSFKLSFPVETLAGTYQLSVGPWFTAAATGQPMAAPYVLSATLGSTGSALAVASAVSTTTTGLSTFRITFSQSIDPTSFTVMDVFMFAPNGLAINPTTLSPVSGSNNTIFTVSFASQTAPGSYQLRIGPYVYNLLGRMMAAPFVETLTI
jgi:hypothetical protein